MTDRYFVDGGEKEIKKRFIISALLKMGISHSADGLPIGKCEYNELKHLYSVQQSIRE